MKHVMELVIGVIMMALVASCFAGKDEQKPVNENTIMDELMEEGWTNIYVELVNEEEHKYKFDCETMIGDNPIMIEGLLVYNDGLEPIKMTAYGYQNGCFHVIGYYKEENGDWEYTEFGEKYLKTVRHYTT